MSQDSEVSLESSRRQFLKQSAVAAGGFVIAFHVPAWPGLMKGALADTAPALTATQKYPPNAFIRIAPDGAVTVTISKLEMGQGVYTSMSQLIAEELDCDWSRIHALSAPVDAVYNSSMMPTQMTGGSTSLNTTYEQYRRIGAVMRQMLIQAAASRWGVDPAECRTEDGQVIHLQKGKLTFDPGRSETQGPKGLQAHWKIRRPDRCRREIEWSSDLWDRRQSARHALRGYRAQPGSRRQDRERQ
jgi:isoquinoline 1-oxidoreductase beta subunit